jgi:hypothetical protein
MRELEENENRAGYQVELEERLALAGCTVARDAVGRRETLGQVVDPDDEDLDEDELEDEELFDQVLEPEHARAVVDELEREDAGDVAGGRE